MAPGKSYNLIVTFKNTGTTEWKPGEYKLKISSGDKSAYSVWSVDEMNLEKTIEPGNTASFEIKVTSPENEDVYNFTAQLVHGTYVFGETNKPQDITVNKQVDYKEALNSAAFVEQTVPTHMEIGKSYKITISMTNTGKTVWTPGLYRLVMLDASGNAYTGTDWNTYSESLDVSVSPGGNKIFIFKVISHTPGKHTLQWRMANSETGLFGDATDPVEITVK